uniref:Translationally-controlled tumor protein homolog n=1 Tax=Heterorhabditis bacteriophora TaxID=37862 RepID=A0A1I7XVQ7_HETBA
MKLVDDLIYEFKGKHVIRKEGEIVLAGSNPSAEEGEDEGSDEHVERGIDIILNHKLVVCQLKLLILIFSCDNLVIKNIVTRMVKKFLLSCSLRRLFYQRRFKWVQCSLCSQICNRRCISYLLHNVKRHGKAIPISTYFMFNLLFIDMFVSAWEEDDSGIHEKNMKDPMEQFLTAAEEGDLNTVMRMLNENRELISGRDGDGYTALHRAAYNNHIDVVSYLLQNGADPEGRHNCVSHWQRESCVADLCKTLNEIDESKQSLLEDTLWMEEGDSIRTTDLGKGRYCTKCSRNAPIRLPFPFRFIFYIGPISIIRWLFGYADLFHAVVCSVFSFSAASFVAALGFFGMQIYYTSYGYTMYEYHNGNFRATYDGDGDSVGERFSLIFGRYWLANFVFPLIWNPPLLTPQIATNLFRVGLLYIFNLIVGTGALALPKAFQTAGYVLSIVVLMISCLVSYVSSTFVIESLSVANAVKARERKKENVPSDYNDVIVSESGPSSFEILQRIELSQMASMFLGRSGVIFSYVALNVYLFGDLAIYSTTVPKSVMNILCSTVNTSTVLPTDMCRSDWPKFLDRFTVYRLSVICFIMICTPMVLMGIAKTKYLQMATTLSRWTAFLLMLFLATSQLIVSGAATNPPAANIHSFGSLFGVAVYAFMCHHSLPSLITPMTSKSGIFSKLSGIYILVLSFYLTLAMTGSFAFSHVQDVYTLNFLHDEFTSVFYFICDHFLALFPVFTLTTNYPIVAITLINNIKVFKEMVPTNNGTRVEEESLLDNDHETPLRPRSRNIRPTEPIDLIIPIIVLGLPTLISMLTDDVLLLAAITGSYPGVGVQFLIPCFLVIHARTYAKGTLNFPVPKKHASPFHSNAWPYAIFFWAAFSTVIVTLNMLSFQF